MTAAGHCADVEVNAEEDVEMERLASECAVRLMFIDRLQICRELTKRLAPMTGVGSDTWGEWPR